MLALGTTAAAGLDVIIPATGEIVGSVSEATGEGVRAAIDSAERGWRDWREVAEVERGQLLRRAAALCSSGSKGSLR